MCRLAVLPLIPLFITGISHATRYEARTTAATSSLVAFTVDTPLAFDTTAHDSTDFIRFRDIPVTNEAGWPEVPSLIYLVALPDSVEPELSWAPYGVCESASLPVYPAPMDSVVNTRTPAVEEFFVQDSAAYASDEWWPEEPVEVLGDIRRNPTFFTGGGPDAHEQFNLLGDPALDIGDRAKYPDCCDLVVYPGHLELSPYAWDIPGGSGTRLAAEVRNNGGSASGAFDVRFTVSSGEDRDVVTIECPSLAPGESGVFSTGWTETWFDPPIDIEVEVIADPEEESDDVWRANNTAIGTVSFNDSYPFMEGWPVEPLGVVTCPPVLVNVDADPALEVVTLSGTLLECRDTDGEWLWRSEAPLSGDVMAADLDGDREVEIIGRTADGVAVFDVTGGMLDEVSLSASVVMAAADMTDAAGVELVVGAGPGLHLYSWDAQNGELDLVDTQTWTYGGTPVAVHLCCADLNGDGYCEAVYECFHSGTTPQDPKFDALEVYDWTADSTLSSRVAETDSPNTAYCAGVLDGGAAIGHPLHAYDPLSGSPAQLVDPLSSTTPTDCEPGAVAAAHAVYGVFADWNALITGLDAFIVPAENQCLAWNALGYLLSGWEAQFSGSSGVTSPALGDLDGDGWADVVSSTSDSGSGVIVSYDWEAEQMISLDYPFWLPDGVCVTSGFSIADIDGDEVPEILFGTSDGLLHCWSTGECDSGYAPWPQGRGSASRAGVLE